MIQSVTGTPPHISSQLLPRITDPAILLGLLILVLGTSYPSKTRVIVLAIDWSWVNSLASHEDAFFPFTLYRLFWVAISNRTEVGSHTHM
jgi:hypothetical protein